MRLLLKIKQLRNQKPNPKKLRNLHNCADTHIMIRSVVMGRLVFVLLSFCVFSGVIAAAEEPSAPTSSDNQAYWLCKHRKEVRTIRVHIDDKGICATLYSKEGEEKLVGKGRNHESCLNFLNSIKSNLEKSNWNCRDISDTKITKLD